MTVICASVVDGVAYMAADSQSTINGRKVFGRSKIVRGDYALLGGAGDEFLIDSMIEALRDYKTCEVGCTALGLMDAVKSCFELYDLNGSDETYNAEILMVDQDGIVVIDSTLAVTHIDASFYAIGSGGDYALGAMEALSGVTAQDILVEHGVCIACKYDTSCSGFLVTETL